MQASHKRYKLLQRNAFVISEEDSDLKDTADNRTNETQLTSTPTAASVWLSGHNDITTTPNGRFTKSGSPSLNVFARYSTTH